METRILEVGEFGIIRDIPSELSELERVKTANRALSLVVGLILLAIVGGTVYYYYTKSKVAQANGNEANKR